MIAPNKLTTINLRRIVQSAVLALSAAALTLTLVASDATAASKGKRKGARKGSSAKTASKPKGKSATKAGPSVEHKDGDGKFKVEREGGASLPTGALPHINSIAGLHELLFGGQKRAQAVHEAADRMLAEANKLADDYGPRTCDDENAANYVVLTDLFPKYNNYFTTAAVTAKAEAIFATYGALLDRALLKSTLWQAVTGIVKIHLARAALQSEEQTQQVTEMINHASNTEAAIISRLRDYGQAKINARLIAAGINLGPADMAVTQWPEKHLAVFALALHRACALKWQPMASSNPLPSAASKFESKEGKPEGEDGKPERKDEKPESQQQEGKSQRRRNKKKKDKAKAKKRKGRQQESSPRSRSVSPAPTVELAPVIAGFERHPDGLPRREGWPSEDAVAKEFQRLKWEHCTRQTVTPTRALSAILYRLAHNRATRAGLDAFRHLLSREDYERLHATTIQIELDYRELLARSFNDYLARTVNFPQTRDDALPFESQTGQWYAFVKSVMRDKPPKMRAEPYDRALLITGWGETLPPWVSSQQAADAYIDQLADELGVAEQLESVTIRSE